MHWGASNHCVILSFEGHGNFVIKVPFTGIAGVWEPEDAHNFRREAQTMEYIRRKTRIPIPDILAFDDTLENALSAPYVLMRGVRGLPAAVVWVTAMRTADGSPNRTL